MRPVNQILDELKASLDYGREFFGPIAAETIEIWPELVPAVDAVKQAMDELDAAYEAVVAANMKVIMTSDVVINATEPRKAH